MTMPPRPGPLPQGERVLSALHIGRYYRRGRRSSGAGGGRRVSEVVHDGHDCVHHSRPARMVRQGYRYASRRCLMRYTITVLAGSSIS